MRLWKRIIYNTIRTVLRLNLSFFYDFHVWGRENIPSEGPKIFCSNHFSSSDPGFVITLMKEPVHMIIGSAFGIPGLAGILRAGEQIDAYDENVRDRIIPEALGYLRKGESVYIFPEGDIGDQHQLRKFYTGIARIYLECPVPVVPIGLISPRRNVSDKDVKVGEVLYHQLRVVSRNYYANIGPPRTFPQYHSREDRKEAARELTEEIKGIIADLIDDIKHNKFWS
jgi:1-acyl-sn-glycerol-3-phosphate acyltransferase